MPAVVGLLCVLVVIGVAVVVPVAMWPLHGCLLAGLFAAQAVARVPLAYLGKRLAVFVPIMGLVAMSLPLSQGFERGGAIAAAVFLRGFVSFMAVIWLTRAFAFSDLLAALRTLRVPDMLVGMLAFVHRYLFVLWEELDTMRTARSARTIGELGTVARWRLSAQMLGMLLVRALGRAERVHGAMSARGWDGIVRRLENDTE